jgi:hypothetical protein
VVRQGKFLAGEDLDGKFAGKSSLAGLDLRNVDLQLAGRVRRGIGFDALYR